MYMPTVARFASRDPLPEDGEPVVLGTSYWYADNSPIMLIDPSGMMAIEPVGTFPKSECGKNAVYTWNFVLPKKASAYCGFGNGGYFVQKVQIWCKRLLCGCDCPKPPQKLGAPDVTYYEAWDVGPNSTMANVQTGKKPKSSFTDQSNFLAAKGYCGYNIAKGEVRFFCKKDTGDLGAVGKGNKTWKINQEFSGTNPDCRSGSAEIPATDNEDNVKKFWPAKSKDGPEMRERSCIYECCEPSPFCNCNGTPKP
jgi:hypothetical protein